MYCDVCGDNHTTLTRQPYERPGTAHRGRKGEDQLPHDRTGREETGSQQKEGDERGGGGATRQRGDGGGGLEAIRFCHVF